MKTSMRNVGIASGLALLSLVGLADSTKANTTDLEIVITAQCAAISVPSYSSKNVASSGLIIPNYLSGGTAQLVTLSCNDPDGFNLNAASKNGGFLDNDANNVDGDKINYTITTSPGTSSATNTGSKTLTPAATAVLIADKSGFVAACAPTTGCNVGFDVVLVTPLTGLRAATYTDTITFSVVGK